MTRKEILDSNRRKYLWRWALPLPTDKLYHLERVHAHHVVSEYQQATHPEIIGWQREAHRRSLGEVLTPALFNGWLPYRIEWWEGPYDDSWVLREYHTLDYKQDYHFMTRIDLAAPKQAPQMVRQSGEDGLSISNMSPYFMDNKTNSEDVL